MPCDDASNQDFTADKQNSPLVSHPGPSSAAAESPGTSFAIGAAGNKVSTIVVLRSEGGDTEEDTVPDQM